MPIAGYRPKRKKRVFKEYYTLPKRPKLADVIRRWCRRKEAGEDHYYRMVPVKDLWRYREYTWSRGAARRNREEWDELKQSMAEEGWNTDNPLLFTIGQKSCVSFVGEGNHRLAIARDLGITHAPVRFIFSEEGSSPWTVQEDLHDYRRWRRQEGMERVNYAFDRRNAIRLEKGSRVMERRLPAEHVKVCSWDKPRTSPSKLPRRLPKDSGDQIEAQVTARRAVDKWEKYIECLKEQ